MKQFLRRLIKFFVYAAAGVVILLAIAVGLFRLFLPRVPEYQDEIKMRASEAIGMQVEFSGMDARWGLSGPELEFYDAEIIRPENGVRVLAAEEVRVGVGFLRLMLEQSVVVDRLVIRETSVDILELEDGSYRIQGVALDELMPSRPDESQAPLKDIEVIGEDIELRFMQPGDKRPHFFEIPRIGVSIDEKRIAADARIQLPDALGRQLDVSAIQVLGMPVEERGWDIVLDADNISLSGWSGLSKNQWQFGSGTGDLELALAFGNGKVRNASAELDFVDVALSGNEFFDISGRVEVDVSDRDWLVAANDLVVVFDDHEWPETTLHVEASVDADGQIIMLDARASYLGLDDLKLIEPWLNDKQKETFGQFEPTGVIRNLVATVSDLGSDALRFNVSADLDRLGLVPADDAARARGPALLAGGHRPQGQVGRPPSASTPEGRSSFLPRS